MRALLDPRLRTAIPEFWPSRVDIRLKTYTTSATNQKIQTGSTSVFNTLLECRLSPIILDRPTDTDTRTIKVTDLTERRHLKINGYYPTIEAEDMQAVVDGKTWEIRGVESDGSHFSTRLRMENILP